MWWKAFISSIRSLHVVIHHDPAAVHLGPQLAGQGGAACHAQRHEHAGDFQCSAVFQLHAGDPLFTEDVTLSAASVIGTLSAAGGAGFASTAWTGSLAVIGGA